MEPRHSVPSLPLPAFPPLLSPPQPRALCLWKMGCGGARLPLAFSSHYSFPWAASLKVPTPLPLFLSFPASLSCSISSSLPLLILLSPYPSLPLAKGKNPWWTRDLSLLPVPMSFCPWIIGVGDCEGILGLRGFPEPLSPRLTCSGARLDAHAFPGLASGQPGPGGTPCA